MHTCEKWAVSWQNQQNGMCPAKTQISLGICPVWSESSLSAWRKLGSLTTHWAHYKDSDQTGQMPKLICVFAGCTCHFVGFVTRRLKCQIFAYQLLYLVFEHGLHDDLVSWDIFNDSQISSRHLEKFVVVYSQLISTKLTEKFLKRQYDPRHKKTCLQGLRPG